MMTMAVKSIRLIIIGLALTGCFNSTYQLACHPTAAQCNTLSGTQCVCGAFGGRAVSFGRLGCNTVSGHLEYHCACPGDAADAGVPTDNGAPQ